MNNLAMIYQVERPNVEVADLTALVIRAPGMIVGKLIREDFTISTVSTVSTVSSKSYFVATTLITSAAQMLIEALELDFNSEHITSRRIGCSLNKMRLTQARQPGGGKRGWIVSLDELIRWAQTYELDIDAITA